MSQPKTFGRYQLIRKVAQGGMAEIFLAKFQGIGGFEKKIIIKRILPRFSENQEFIKMLIHEAKTAVQLHHQNIVQIYDLGKVRDTYFISMEYIRGKDLRTVLNRLKSQGQLMPRELAVFITREICKGLDYAHNITDQHGEPLNLVHRDISPPNILLSLEGEVKIIDFGIAKATSQATDTQAGVFKGKFAYMAPEQASGLPVDRRADIFATGLILWEMLTCRKLLEAESDILTLERAKKIDSYNAPFGDYNIPEQLEHIIRKALKQDRNGRYQTAGEMARDLTIYLNLNYPGFSESDLADNLRQLFNLDKRRSGGTGELVTPQQGERSLTGSDFFRALAQTGTEHTDPSVKVPRDLGAGAVALGAGAGGAVASTSTPLPPPRKKPERAANDSGEFWSLENDIRDEIEVFGLAATQGAAQGAPAANGGGQGGWVSQLAEGFVQAEDGTLHPLIKDALKPRAEALGPEGARPDDPTILVRDGQVVRVEQLGVRNGAAGVAALPTASLRDEQPVGMQDSSVFAANDRRRRAGIWAIQSVATALLLFVVFSLAFPAQTQQLKEALGLVKKAQVTLTLQPPDAEVLVNGVPQQRLSNPAVLSLGVGQRYQLVVRKAGFIEYSDFLDLVSSTGPRQLNVSLLPEIPRGDGQIVLKGLLPNSVVYLNGTPVNQEQLSQLPRKQPLQLRVMKEHYVPFETSVTLGDEPVTLEVVLVPEPVELRVDAGGVPKAAVSIDGNNVGLAPYKNGGYIPGKSYRVEISAPNYRPYTTIVTPTVGSATDLRVSLVPQSSPTPTTQVATTKTSSPKSTPTPTPAAAPTPPVVVGPLPTPAPPVAETPRAKPASGFVQVSIIVTPWADIYLDGKYIGRTPVRNLPIKVGRHTLRLVNPELQIDYEVEKEISPPQYGGEVQTFNFELG